MILEKINPVMIFTDKMTEKSSAQRPLIVAVNNILRLRKPEIPCLTQRKINWLNLDISLCCQGGWLLPETIFWLHRPIIVHRHWLHLLTYYKLTSTYYLVARLLVSIMSMYWCTWHESLPFQNLTPAGYSEDESNAVTVQYRSTTTQISTHLSSYSQFYSGIAFKLALPVIWSLH